MPRTLVLVALSAIISGCGAPADLPPLGQVSGVVLLDGKPLEGAMIQFQPTTTRPSIATTDKDGRYTLKFNDSYNGAAIGEHVVRISRRADPAKNPELGNAELVPAAYNDQTTLKRQVVAGPNTFDFPLASTPSGLAKTAPR